MSTKRTVNLAALNIVTHPHSKAGYTALLEEATELKQPIKIWGDVHGLLWSWYDYYDTGELYTGEIFIYSEIDMDQEWLDLARGEAASNKQLKEVTIPAHLKPHFKRVRFAFFANIHLIVFAEENAPDGSLGVTRMQKFLSRLLNDNRLLENRKFTEVQIRLVQSKEAIEEIFEKIAVKTLEILVEKPNGDDGGEAEQSVEDELEEENVSSYFIKMKAAPNEEIDPNQRTMRYMEEAALNGHVKARGVDRKTGRKKTVKTKDHPLIEGYEWDTGTGFLEFFLDGARKLAKKAKKKLRDRSRSTEEDQEE